MRQAFEGLVYKYRAVSVGLDIELLGTRPCMGDVDPVRQRALEEAAAAVMQAETGKAPSFGPASTDCNIPFSLGIPALCTGGYTGEGAHRRDEWVDARSFLPGLRVVMGIIAQGFEGL
jgi:di/tripeptidase